MMGMFAGRLGLQQRVLPSYRAPFFEMLAAACEGGLGVFAGMPRPGEGIASASLHSAQHFMAHNVHLLGGPLYLCYQRGFTKWLQSWNPDALIVEANPRYLSTPAAARWMHGCGRKVIGWGLGAPATGAWSAIRRSGWRRFLQQFDGLIAYSRRGAEEYAALGFPRERIFIAPNAAAARPVDRPVHEPLGEGPQTVLFVGRLQARKRVDRLLRACAAMPEPRPRLLIVGDGPELGKLEALARQAYPEAEFAGARHGEELEPYFVAADLFVLPGTGGLAIQQAMAHALPVIVAKGDGTQDDLVREANGWQVPPEDEQALVTVMRSALSDAGRLRKMGDESFQIVRDEINLEKMVEVFVRAINSV